MESIRSTLWLLKLAILIAGPAGLLAVWWSQTGRLPNAIKFLLASVAACTFAYWFAFLLAEQILALQYHEIVPEGIWTRSDEARWTEAERRIVGAHFGDGGRNVLAVYVWVPLFLNSIVLWFTAWVVNFAVRRRAVQQAHAADRR